MFAGSAPSHRSAASAFSPAGPGSSFRHHDCSPSPQRALRSGPAILRRRVIVFQRVNDAAHPPSPCFGVASRAAATALRDDACPGRPNADILRQLMFTHLLETQKTAVTGVIFVGT